MRTGEHGKEKSKLRGTREVNGTKGKRREVQRDYKNYEEKLRDRRREGAQRSGGGLHRKTKGEKGW